MLAEHYTVSGVSLKAYDRIWLKNRSRLPWQCLFVTPFWLQTVVDHLGSAGDPLILIVTHDGVPVGIVPLSIDGSNAYFLGIPDVCDYQDVILASGHEAAAMETVLTHLSEMGVHRLDLHTLRPDAALVETIESSRVPPRATVTHHTSDVTYEMPLPGAWDDYLMQLNGKRRHEIRRKIRRLEAYGAYRFRMADDGRNLDVETDQFLRLFHLNRTDKSRFMDDTMVGYFRTLIRRLAHQKMLRLYFLEVEDRPVAAVLCFDYHGTRYLYNSGYDASYQELSVGILSKIFSIREALENRCRRYDFLKGDEVYKKRIGGRKIPLSRYEIKF